MRIAQLSAWYPPDSIGGTEIYVAALCRDLRAAGHDVRVAVPRRDIGAPQTDTWEGTPVFRFPIPPAPTRDEARGYAAARGTEHLQRWIQDFAPDVVHVHSIATGLHLPELRAVRSSCTCMVMTGHLPILSYVCERGTLAEWGEHACDGRREPRRCAACALQARGVPRPLASALVRATPPRLARAARRWPGRLGTVVAMRAFIEALAEQQAALFSILDSFVLLNDTAMRIVLGNCAPVEKLTLNRLGISHTPSPKPSAERAPTLLPVRVGYVGRFHRTKGVDTLLDAIERLPASCPISFDFRGPVFDTESRTVAAAIAALQSRRSNVTLGAAVLPADVPALLATYDVVCVPSRWFENGPTIALEAVAAGTPVIGTRIGGFVDLIEDGVNGRLVEPHDVAALSTVFLEIAQDPSNTIDRWRRRLRPVRTMQQISSDYMALYEDLCGAVLTAHTA